jgi:hypothetical protein
MGTMGDSQSILNEVSKLRQKYDECRESQGVAKGIDPKVLGQARNEKQKLILEVTRKEGAIKSLERTMLERDRSYRETNARNKNLIAQLHTQNVTQQEREMLKRALIAAKGELALAQKELRGGSTSIVKIREELKTTKETLTKLQTVPSKAQGTEKIVTKVVEPTEKILALQAQLNTANTIIAQLRSAPQKTPVQQPQVIYKDRIVTQEKIVYKDRPVEKVVTKKIESIAKVEALQRELASAQATISNLRSNGSKTVYKDRVVTKEKIVYRDRPVEKVITKTIESRDKIDALRHELSLAQTALANLKKNPEKIVYKDRVVTQEKVVYKDRPVEKVVTKTIVQEKTGVDEVTRRKMDKLALDLERQKTLNLKLTNDLTKVSRKPIVTSALPPLPSGNLRATVKKIQPAVENNTVNAKKASGVYRMASDASIYIGPNGKIVDTWEARRSFTGSSPSNGWVHITGYFVNRVFQPVGVDESLWVKENDTVRR